ncbi:MAG: protein kinase domain-containing protein [Planctomycetota bacterium]|jgi:serine/threonine protein kinase
MTWTDPQLGVSIGGFRLDAVLGRGGMGTVYRATQLRLNRPVALKVLPPTMDLQGKKRQKRFLQEAQIAAQLSHPNIVQVYDAGEFEGLFFIAMELIEGETLRQIVDARGPLREPDAFTLALQCCRALEAALEKNLIHRDIKPDNIMITRKGLAKVADFGLARDLASSSRITAPGAVIGTPAFMSPEQGAGMDVDHRSDLYSLGATLYFVLTGKFPFPGPSPVAIIHMHIQDPVPDPRAVNPALTAEGADIVMGLMAKRPEERPPNVGPLIQSIEGLFSGPFAQISTVGGATTADDPALPSGEEPAFRLPPPPAVAGKKGDGSSGTLEVPSDAFQMRRGDTDRHLRETAHDFEEGARPGEPTLAEVEAKPLRLLPSLPRSGPLERGLLLVRASDPLQKIFLVSKEEVRLGRQGAVAGPGGERMVIDLLVRALPCRDRERDEENYKKNLTISRYHASIRVEENQVVLVNRRSQGLSVAGREVPAGKPLRLPEHSRVNLSRGAILLDVRIYPSGDAGRFFRVEGEPAPPGRGLMGMEGAGKISAVRIRRPVNAPGHGYTILLRRAGIGEGEEEAIRVPGTGKGGWIFRYNGEYFIGPKKGGPPLTVSSNAVPFGALAPLAPGAVVNLGNVALDFRLPDEVDFKEL